MKLQKKIGAGLLALALVLSLGACSGSADSSTASNAASSRECQHCTGSRKQRRILAARRDQVPGR